MSASLRERLRAMASTWSRYLVLLAITVFLARLGQDLVLKLQENPTRSFLRIGIHYDDLYKSAALINLTRKHLVTPTPYNTYRKRGLPPGPIASPGLFALRAAANPAETKALYFVARGDGTHEFSATLKEHNRAVRRYQLRR